MGGGYGRVYQNVMRNPDLTPEAKAIYGYLSSFAGMTNTCYPSVELMIKELSMSKTRYYKHLLLLVDAGIVSKQQERVGQRLGKMTYTIHHGAEIIGFEDTQNDETEPCEVSSFVDAQDVDAQDVDAQDAETKSNRLTINSTKNNSPNSNIHIRVCDLLNEAKRKASSKGRLKPNTYPGIIDNLRAGGMSDDMILRAAQEIADMGRDIDWLDFERYCKKSRWR